MSTDSNTDKGFTVTSNPGAYVITVAFTRRPGLPHPSHWDATRAAQEVLDTFRDDYEIDSARVVSIEQTPGTVTMPEDEFRRVMRLASLALDQGADIGDPADADAGEAPAESYPRRG